MMDDELKGLMDLSSLTDISTLQLSGALNSETPMIYEEPDITPTVSNPTNRTPDLESDYSTAREMVHFQQQLLKMAMLKQFENATMSDLPRQMEVLATLSTQITNSTKQLLDIQKQMKDVTQEEVKTTNAGTTVQAEAVYIGGATDILSNVGTRQDYLKEVEVDEYNKENDEK